MRESYGPGEQAAHDIMRTAAGKIGLEVAVDAIGNLMMTLPGRDRSVPRILIGSHLDSVPQGGNFDGAAGVVAGLSAVSALRQAGIVPGCDIVVMGIRAEESAWFDVAYVGSAGAFGLLDPACLAMRRSDDGPSLEAAITQAGFDPAAIRERRSLLDPAQIRAYLELHIEQGPTLAGVGLPAAVVSGIRGCKRFRNARCTGRVRSLGRRLPCLPARCGRGHRGAAASSWRPSGCNRRRRARTSSSPPVNSSPTRHCTVRVRLPAKRASSRPAQPLASHDGRCHRRGACRRRAPRAGLPGQLRSRCHQRFASGGDGRAVCVPA